MERVLRRPRTLKIGVYLGVTPGAGGMFQYAQSVLDALAALPEGEFQVSALFGDPLWEEHLRPLGLPGRRFGAAQLGPVLSNGLLAAGAGPRASRLVAWAQPAARAMLEEARDLWIFPAQDVLSFQVPVRPLVAVHDLMHRYARQFPEVSSMGRYRLRERRFRGIASTAAGILVDSQVGKRQFIESYGGDPARVHVLPYVPPRYIYGTQTSSTGFDERYRLPAKFAFYPAQFWTHKNHERLLAAVATLKDTLPDVHLVLAGSRTLRYAAIARRCRELAIEDRVTFVGRVPDEDMPEFYRRARMLVMPTFFGPTNIPPLEAFALGCPVAVSGIYGMPEQVGDAAVLFNPASEAEIAHAIRSIWIDDNLAERLRSAGLKRSAQWHQAEFSARFRSIVELSAGHAVG